MLNHYFMEWIFDGGQSMNGQSISSHAQNLGKNGFEHFTVREYFNKSSNGYRIKPS